MMKNYFILILAILLPLSAFEMSADEKEARKIPLRIQEGTHFERSLIQTPIESYYIGGIAEIYTVVDSGFGQIDITVINFTTGESWNCTFDPNEVSHIFLPISGAPGFYEITYFTSFGDLYEGTFTIE